MTNDNWGADHGLNEKEIESRNNFLEDFKIKILDINNYFSLNLPISNIESMLEPGMPSLLADLGGSQKVFDLDWAHTKKEEVNSYIVNYLSKEILKKFIQTSKNKEDYIGSSKAIANRIYKDYFSSLVDHYEINLALHDWRIRILERIEELYEKSFKTYKLWNENALSLLIRFLFSGTRDSIYFENHGALWEYLPSDNLPIEIDTLINYVTKCIASLPIEDDLTEAAFPDYNGVIFTRYVPPENMSPMQKEMLYKTYLEEISLYSSDCN